MTNRHLAMFFLALSFFMLSSTQAMALTIRVDSDGTISYLEDRVLGEDTENGEKEDEREKEQEDMRSPEPLRVVAPDASKQRQIKISPEKEKKNTLRLELNERQKGSSSRLENVEKQELNKMKLEIKDSQSELRDLRMDRAKELQQLNSELKDASPELRKKVLEEKREEVRVEIEKKREEVQDDRGDLKEQRQEKFEIRARQDGEESELELRSQSGVRARLKGADFAVDPETGIVTVTTPSGQTKELNNLPDDVIERIQKLQTVQSTGTESVDVEVENDGSVKHRVKGVKQAKKLFGFIPRQVSGDAVVDDATGDVEFEEENTFANRVLRLFSSE